ncbi:MAG TPA: SRPBCC family protein [Fluviicola sp.]|nr:SRPBCC family protein [Fluviicola sp.]
MYRLKREQLVRTDLQTCWDFFSSPQNLAVITPEKLRFTVLSEQPARMYEGLMIAYTVSPVLGIPLGWITEIKTVKEGLFFVDEQRKGPYRIWHHEHHFEAVEGGVLMTDIVSYTLPFGFLGKFAHWLFVRKQLEAIFEYRFRKVEELFNRS